jgi:cobalamin biosynthesis protein CobW
MTLKIPATVVTGFLGAGKTSLIRYLLEHSGGRRLGASDQRVRQSRH